MKAATYIPPTEVHAPKKHWTLVHVLFDGGPDRHDGSGTNSSLAIGRWDGRPVLAMRWNGDKDSQLGNPQSRGLPTWFIVPAQHVNQILETEQYGFSETRLEFARNFIEFRRVYFLSHCPTPKCQNFKNLVLASFRPEELGEMIALLEKDDLRFYCIYCDQQWHPTPEEKPRLMKVLTDARDLLQAEA